MTDLRAQLVADAECKRGQVLDAIGDDRDLAAVASRVWDGLLDKLRTGAPVRYERCELPTGVIPPGVHGDLLTLHGDQLEAGAA